MLLKVFTGIVFLLLLSCVAMTTYGTFHWRAGTQKLRDRLNSSRLSDQPSIVHMDEMIGLPAPVQRYFQKALQDGQLMIAGVHLRHHGTFNVSNTAEQWRPFTSEQQVSTQHPGFDWNGRVMLLPGIPVLVHDAYIAGEGILHAALLGLFPLVNLQGTGDIAQGELMRFFAEAAWYPTALLPSQGIQWKAVSDRSAQGTLVREGINVTMLFTFNEQDLIEYVCTEARGRTVNGQLVPTPWCGHFWNYEERNGMQIPLDGEVAWLLPDGAKPYWRRHLTEITYQFVH